MQNTKKLSYTGKIRLIFYSIYALVFYFAIQFRLVTVATVLFIAFFLSFIVLSILFDRKMKAYALVAENGFIAEGYNYNYKFTTTSAILYFNDTAEIRVIWKKNPTEVGNLNAAQISKIRTNTNEILGGTQLVCSEFFYYNKKVRITTLEVTGKRGLLMSDARVQEAISKADYICGRLYFAQQTALSNTAVRE